MASKTATVDGTLNPVETPTVTIDQATSLIGISRSSAYTAASAGQIPTIRIGRRLLVPTAGLRRLLQLDNPGA